MPLESQAEFVIGAMDECRSPAVNQVFSEVVTECTKAIAANPNKIFEIRSRYFEYVIAEVLRSFGFDVDLTARTRDGGVDILAVSRRANGELERWLVECKRWARQGKVSVGLVRQLYGVKARTGADHALLVTTATFSRDAWKFVNMGQRLDLHLVDQEALSSWLAEYLRRHA